MISVPSNGKGKLGSARYDDLVPFLKRAEEIREQRHLTEATARENGPGAEPSHNGSAREAQVTDRTSTK